MDIGNIQFSAQEFIVLAVTFVIFHSIWKRWKKKDYPPGPWAWPVVGNLPEISHSKYIYKDYVTWQKKYGGVFSVQLGLTDYIIINTIDLAKEAFQKKPKDFIGRPWSASVDIFTQHKDMVFGPPDQKHALARKVTHGAVRKYALSDDLMQRCQTAVDMIHKEFTKHGNKPQSTSQSMDLLLYNIIAGMCFGKSFEPDDPFFLKFTATMDDINATLGSGFLADAIPILRHVPTKAIKDIKLATKMIKDFISQALEEHRATYDPDNVTDLTYHVLEMEKEMKVEAEKGVTPKLTMENLYLIILNVFFAGTDTTRMTLQWVLLLLTAHQDVQQKVWQEINSVVGVSRYVKISDRASLPYLEAVILETLRFRPVVPLGLPRCTTCDTTLGGYKIPKDTGVMLNIYALHNDAKEWHQPELFKPERFIDENGCVISNMPSFVPFSLGRRNCVGQLLAKADLNLLAAMLIQRFKFLPPDGQSIDMEPVPGGFVMSSKPEVKINIQPRNVEFCN